ncbi:uncharacterized protein LOC133893250 [Phragmites australis]|uniref:uncharacterized protein LOC133893250 n=1 Tax=Phragmites australis TaxID=29695 RepID=UPI002D777A71|nr:uncharacterized protein LOC133893250 [Phragmites australis]
MDPCEELVYRAKLAVPFMIVDALNHVAMLDTELTVEERNLVGYKNVISAKCAWQRVHSIKLKEKTKGTLSHFPLVLKASSPIFLWC